LPPAGTLARFQHDFARALLDGNAPADGSADVTALARQPGFAVYRNTVLKGCIDALQANYPAIAALVGEEWFRAAAALYARANLPLHPTLLHYGAGFAEFLAAFEPAAGLPYLSGVARLDRFWTEAHMARDEPPLAPGALGGMPSDELPCVVLRPHASARWAWFDDQPIYTLWSRNRPGDGAAAPRDDDAPIEWRGEGALIVRPYDVVHRGCLGRAGCAFLDACAAGRTLASAGEAASAVDPAADLAALGTQLFAAGAFGPIRPGDA
jgi:hypothetical protein